MGKTTLTILMLLGMVLNMYPQGNASKQETRGDVPPFFDNAALIFPDLYSNISKAELSEIIICMEEEVHNILCGSAKEMGNKYVCVECSDGLYYEYENAIHRFPLRIETDSHKFILGGERRDEDTDGDERAFLDHKETKESLVLKKYTRTELMFPGANKGGRIFSFYLCKRKTISGEAKLEIAIKGKGVNKEIKISKRSGKACDQNSPDNIQNNATRVFQTNTSCNISTAGGIFLPSIKLTKYSIIQEGSEQIR